MFCASCGNKISDTAKFCSHCGATVQYNSDQKRQVKAVDQLMSKEEPQTLKKEKETPQNPVNQIMYTKEPWKSLMKYQPTAETEKEASKTAEVNPEVPADHKSQWSWSPLSGYHQIPSSKENPSQSTVRPSAPVQNDQNLSNSIPINQQQTRANANYQQHLHHYHYLGGWLLYFVIDFFACAFFAGIFGINSIQYYQSLNQLYTIYDSLGYTPISGGQVFFIFVVFILLTALFGILGIMIIKKNPLFLRFFEITQITGFVLTLVLTIFTPSVFMIVFVLLCIAVMSTVLRIMYFRKSVRVRTYMGSDEYLRNSLFSKNVISPIPADSNSTDPF